MTHTELSLKIAEHLEPKPNRCIGELEESGDELPGLWVPHEQLAGDWQPRDFINDPAMTVMLIKLCIEIEDLELWKWTYNGVEHYHAEIEWGPADGSEHIIGQSPNLGRAVAEAFARANGLL